MKLPAISHPIHAVTLTDGVKFSFRPFLVKDEKLLLQALESDDEQTIYEATKQVVNNCAVDSTIDVDTLPMFDLEYIYLNLRAKSIGEKVTQSFTCKNEIKDKEGDDWVAMVPCNGPIEFEVDLTKIVLPAAPSRKIALGDNIGVFMRYPSADSARNITDEEDTAGVEDIILDCIESIYDAESVYPAKDSTREELRAWLEELDPKNMDKIADWFEKLPVLVNETTVKCGKCGFEHYIRQEGLGDFFD